VAEREAMALAISPQTLRILSKKMLTDPGSMAEAANHGRAVRVDTRDASVVSGGLSVFLE
jgi:hypothetical protein